MGGKPTKPEEPVPQPTVKGYLTMRLVTYRLCIIRIGQTIYQRYSENAKRIHQNNYSVEDY